MIYFIYKWRMLFSRHESMFFVLETEYLQDPTTKIVDTVCFPKFLFFDFQPVCVCVYFKSSSFQVCT